MGPARAASWPSPRRSGVRARAAHVATHAPARAGVGLHAPPPPTRARRRSRVARARVVRCGVRATAGGGGWPPPPAARVLPPLVATVLPPHDGRRCPLLMWRPTPLRACLGPLVLAPALVATAAPPVVPHVHAGGQAPSARSPPPPCPPPRPAVPPAATVAHHPGCRRRRRRGGRRPSPPLRPRPWALASLATPSSLPPPDPRTRGDTHGGPARRCRWHPSPARGGRRPRPPAAVVVLHGSASSGPETLNVVRALLLLTFRIRAYTHWVAPTAVGGWRHGSWFGSTRNASAPGGRSFDGPTLSAAAARIEAIVANERARGVPRARVAVVGFSQGGALALEVGRRLGQSGGGGPLAGWWSARGLWPTWGGGRGDGPPRAPVDAARRGRCGRAAGRRAGVGGGRRPPRGGT
ncbi:hypothetical protein BU14_1868s0001 [Porphyra umbilicalis]|uniref:Phospholipase/carboxylesterase/thioesterase domain-containing protein n=1 Tax=Porphyra umbilicalis TaxID=2786 RepID=A0A1X6NL82_PORUM|nr:hypothetical protein BU14_1868s0001 [Porphyra umbilicalis]|eukprot:OSX69093.1 hypothetical protein BU14_1868s0001 [Porphyra umbilicalis]